VFGVVALTIGVAARVVGGRWWVMTLIGGVALTCLGLYRLWRARE
jgi:hypothetical protein